MGDILRLLARGSIPGLIYSAFEPIWKGKDSWYGQIFGKIKDVFEDPSSLLSGLDEHIGSYLDKTSGAHLTPAEVEQNEWTAKREDTRFQRQVADMEAAGLNPALMYSSGASAPSVNSSAGGIAGSGSISDLLQFAMLPLHMKKIQADIDFTKAGSQKLKEEASGVSLDNVFKQATLEARKEAENLALSLKRSQISKINGELDEIIANTHKLAEEAKTEESKRDLNFAAALLDRVNAQVAVEILPYSQALAEAQTTAQKNYAALMAVQKLYQSKLVNGGYVDAICKQMKESADSQEARTAVDKINSDIRSGKFGNDGSFLGKLGSGLLQGTVLALDQLKGIASVGLHFGKNLGSKPSKNDNVNPAYNYDPFGYLAGE